MIYPPRTKVSPCFDIGVPFHLPSASKLATMSNIRCLYIAVHRVPASNPCLFIPIFLLYFFFSF